MINLKILSLAIQHLSVAISLAFSIDIIVHKLFQLHICSLIQIHEASKPCLL